jgi:hypothetical protein
MRPGRGACRNGGKSPASVAALHAGDQGGPERSHADRASIATAFLTRSTLRRHGGMGEADARMCRPACNVTPNGVRLRECIGHTPDGMFTRRGRGEGGAEFGPGVTARSPSTCAAVPSSATAARGDMRGEAVCDGARERRTGTVRRTWPSCWLVECESCSEPLYRGEWIIVVLG